MKKNFKECYDSLLAFVNFSSFVTQLLILTLRFY